MELYSKALILGQGRSGQAAERLLRQEGTEVHAVSRETTDDAGLARILASEFFDICIVSPGFGLAHPWMVAVREAGIPLLSELELGWSRFLGGTIAVTGSNGKSTAVKWICETLQEAGHSAAIGGNYGIPACDVVMRSPGLEWLVLEVSSFQLETVRRFRARIAVVLNILPNHLDRHGSMENYWQTKARIFGTASAPSGTCIAPEEWAGRFASATGVGSSWTTFGSGAAADYRFEDGRVWHGGESVLDLEGTPFNGPVLGSCTGAAVAAVAAAAGVPFPVVRRVASRFETLPHRMHEVGRLNGVAYINDSKATNLSALAAAVQSCGTGIHLIAGGLPKETDFTFIKEVLAKRVRRIYLIGQASRAMYRAWNEECFCVECGTLDEAFGAAKEAAISGETILLSPGCASFDQFGSFEERGTRFETLFREGLLDGAAG